MTLYCLTENFDTDLLDNVNIGPLNEEINFSITQEEILRCINRLKNNKTCGEDCVVNKYIKSTSDLFLPTFEKIFNAIFDSGVMPDAWLVYVRIEKSRKNMLTA